MADSNRFIVAFENVSATFAGIDISSILELQLYACANSYPCVTLMVDAGHPGAASTPLVGDKVSLSEAGSLYSKCIELVKTSGATLSLALTARSVGGGNDVQTLNINGWMLTDVALSPIQEGGVCAVSLTFAHPLCKAHFGGVVPGLLTTEPDWSTLQGGDPLSVYVGALNKYATAPREKLSGQIAGMANQYKVRANLLKRLSQAASDLGSALSWSGGGLPASKVAGTWVPYIRRGIACYAVPSEGSSALGRFLAGVVPECSLAVGGDYMSGKLNVGPYVPWSDPTLSISDSDIVSMQFPGRDPTPISGVRVESMESSYTNNTSMQVDAVQIENARADNYYIPQKQLDAEYLYGPIHQFSEPGWLQRAQAFMVYAENTARSDCVSAQNGNYQDSRTVKRGDGVQVAAAVANTPKATYGKVLLACAKAYFETSLMKDWEFTVGARFIVQAGGGVLCPGKVLAVRSAGSSVLAGYVTSVTHTISVQSRTAHTEIVCSHPRSGTPPFGVGSSNALY